MRETGAKTISLLLPSIDDMRFEQPIGLLADSMSDCFRYDESRARAEHIQIAVGGKHRQSFWIGKESPQVRRRDIGNHRVDGWRLIAHQQQVRTGNGWFFGLRRSLFGMRFEQIGVLQIRRREIHTETLVGPVWKGVL